MSPRTTDFALAVEGVEGVCPAGEVYSKQKIAEQKIPVFSCEGPCIRGDIARLAANMVANDVPALARACHAETFLVPHSSMAQWVKGADTTIMIDGCFLQCHGRVLKKLIGEEKVVQLNAFPFYKKYTDIFLMDDVPEAERKAVAREVADKIIAMLKNDARVTAIRVPAERVAEGEGAIS
ncbi:MAG TPA: putative zinc-binding protein [Xanthobacteraceae bacterium]|nr:putative zinc-binding protein [Xanthobacteraceae bacterium]